MEFNKKAEGKKGAPAYIVSFSALMTILLTFFILMCGMANEQECGLVAAGTGSFRRNINAFGLPGLLSGHRTTVDLGEGRPQFAVPERAVETASSDSNLMYRRVVQIEPIRLPRALINHFEKEEELRIPLNIDFADGEADLNVDAKKYLQPLVERLRMVRYHIRVEAYVNRTFMFNVKYQNAWQLSAARAAAVVRYIGETGGLSYQRLHPVGYGSARPMIKGAIDPRVNDRVVLVIEKR